MNTMEHFQKWRRSSWLLAGFSLIAGLGLLDFLTGYELSVSLFYLLPISLLVWFVGKPIGVAASVISAMVWLLADVLSGNRYSVPIIFFWNAIIRFGFYFIVTLLLAELKTAWEHEKKLSRTDGLTGAANASFFHELLQTEVNRHHRYQHPFTIAYIDLDHFKAINDQFGHSVGDEVLRRIVDYCRHELRIMDTVARLGGDEFAILFPETDESMAQAAVSKIQQGLLAEMRKNHWDVTFSIGAITFKESPETANDLIKLADELMYTAKNNGKNTVRYSIYTG